jgi:hypothetical protein
MLNAITYLLFSQLAVGGLLSISLVPDQAGKSFFRFCSAACTILLAVGLFVANQIEIYALLSLSVSATMACLSTLLIITDRMRFARVSLITATVAGAIGLAAQGATSNPEGFPLWVPTTSSAYLLTGSMFLGSIIFAMALGHWYLNVPTLPIWPLRRLTKLMIVATCLKAVLLGVVLSLGGSSDIPEITDTIASFSRMGGLFFWGRVLFGLIGPIVIGYMTWETVKLNATQSATGLLYVNTILVLIGETLSLFLYHTTHLPV